MLLKVQYQRLKKTKQNRLTRQLNSSEKCEQNISNKIKQKKVNFNHKQIFP